MEAMKRLVVVKNSGLKRGVNRGRAGHLWDSGAALHGTVKVDRGHCICQNPWSCATERVNPNVNYGLSLIIMT